VIGVWAAALLFGASVWVIADGLYAPAQVAPELTRRSSNRLRQLLVEADLEHWSPAALVAGSAVLALVVFAVSQQAIGWVVPSAFAMTGAAIVPVLYVLWRRDARLAETEEALVVTLARAQEELRTGTMQEMLISLGGSAPLAVRSVFQRLARDLEHQRDFADALRASQVRLASSVWDSCVAALLLSHSVGERNLRATLQRVTATARAEVQLRRSIRAQQAQHITSARITMLVPIAVVVMMRLGYPAAERFYASTIGELILLVCGGCIVAGYWWMLRIGRVSRGRRPQVLP
jgi:Flp pilus assembly protein TadB